MKWLENATKRLADINEKTKAEEKKVTKEEKDKRKLNILSGVISFIPALIISAVIFAMILSLADYIDANTDFNPPKWLTVMIGLALFALFFYIWQLLNNFVEKKMKNKD